MRKRRTCISIERKMDSGPLTKPIRIPADRILDKLSNRITRPTFFSSNSRAKYDGTRGALP